MNQKNKHLADEIFKELKSLANKSFPKECVCGRVYKDLDEFLCQTQELADSPGMFGDELAAKSIIDLMRNCSCGSTLMVLFSERRKVSQKGSKLRETFEQLMQILINAGISTAAARQSLRDILHNKENDLLRDKLSQEDVETIRQQLEKSREEDRRDKEM